MKRMLLPALLLLTGQTPPPDTPASQQEVQLATKAAGQDLTEPLFLCRADSWQVVRQAMTTADQWQKPARAFDNLFFVGNAFVGVWVLKTSAGLILFDATETQEEARDHLVPGLRALGLDPATIHTVVVTHGHWDHFGGAAWLQRTYGAHVALSAADWDLIESLPQGAPERHAAELPKRDIVVADGQKLRLGDTEVTLYVTPGHTPGTVSAIVPAKLGGKAIPLSLLGSVAFPVALEPTARAGGLLAYDRSVQRFSRISLAAGAQGIINTHIFADGTRRKLDALADETAGKTAGKRRNPFLIGADATARYYDVLHHCLLAAQARLAKAP